MRIRLSKHWNILLLWLLLPAIALAQPIEEDTKNVTTTGNFTTATVTGLIASGTDRGIAVCVYSKPDALTVSSVVFNGTENATFVNSEVSGGGRDLEIWYLGNPTATTANVVVTLSGAATLAATLVSATSFSGVAPDVPALENAGECGACATLTLGLTSTVGNTLMYTCASHTSGTQTWVHNAGQFELSDFVNAVNSNGGISTSYEVKVAPGLETLGSTPSAGSNISMVVMGIAPAEAPAASSRRRMGVFQ